MLYDKIIMAKESNFLELVVPDHYVSMFGPRPDYIQW